MDVRGEKTTRARKLGQVYGKRGSEAEGRRKAAGEGWVGPGMQVGTHVTCLKGQTVGESRKPGQGESEGQAWSYFGIISQESHPTRAWFHPEERKGAAQWVCPWGDMCVWGSRMPRPHSGRRSEETPSKETRPEMIPPAQEAGAESRAGGGGVKTGKEVQDRDTAQKK